MTLDNLSPQAAQAESAGGVIPFLRRRILHSPALLLWLLLVMLGVACSGSTTMVVSTATSPATPCLTPGCRAPNFSLETLSGEKIELATLRGQPVIINFWTSWCDFCMDELPDFEQIYQQEQGQGVVVLAVNQQEPAERVRGLVDRLQLTFPVMLDRSGSVGVAYRVETLPTTIIVDRQGIIYHVQSGYLPRAELESYLSLAMVAEPTPVVDAQISQATPTPAATPTETPVPTPTPLILMEGCVASTALNIRTGPGNESVVVAGLVQGECRTFDGRTGDGNWLRLSDDYLFKGERMWVAARHVALDGDKETLRVVE